jgi:hypothetical protein
MTLARLRPLICVNGRKLRGTSIGDIGPFRKQPLDRLASAVHIHKSALIGRPCAGSVFNGLADQMVDAFARRAEKFPPPVPGAP